jgi:hypothetical protein
MMLTKALEIVSDPTISEKEKLQLTTEINRILTEKDGQGRYKSRESFDLWNETKKELEGDQTTRNWIGYFTGVYGKQYTSADAEFRALKLELNNTRIAINSEVGADILGIDGGLQERKDYYENLRYNTPEGSIYNMSINIDFTWLNGIQLTGQQRRDHVSEQQFEDQQRSEYFTQLEEIGLHYREELEALGFGADHELEQAIYAEWAFKREQLAASYPSVRSPWRAEYKPSAEIFDHYLGIMMREIRAKKPLRNEGEDYMDWQGRVVEWRNKLPMYVEAQTTAWTESLGRWPDAVPGLTTEMIEQIVDGVSYANYEQWRRDNNTLYQDMDEAYDELYLRPYFEITSGAQKSEYPLRHNRAMNQLKMPDALALWEWIESRQPGKWTLAEVEQKFSNLTNDGMSSPGVLLEAYIRQGETPEEAMEHRIWEILSWIGPGRGFTIFKDEANLHGIDPSAIDMWYETGGKITAWKDPEEWESLYRAMQNTAFTMGLRPPTDEELEQRVIAEGLQKEFMDEMERLFGGKDLEFYTTMAQWYNIKDPNIKSRFREQHKDVMIGIDNYTKLKLEFAGISPKHAVWAKYYLPGIKLGKGEEMPSTYNSYALAMMGDDMVQEVASYLFADGKLSPESREELSFIFDRVAGKTRTKNVERWLQTTIKKELAWDSIFGINTEGMNGLPDEITNYTQFELERLFESDGAEELSRLAELELQELWIKSQGAEGDPSETFEDYLEGLRSLYNVGWRAEFEFKTLQGNMDPKGETENIPSTEQQPGGMILAGHMLLDPETARIVGKTAIDQINFNMVNDQPIHQDTIRYFMKLISWQPQWGPVFNQILTGDRSDTSWKLLR